MVAPSKRAHRRVFRSADDPFDVAARASHAAPRGFPQPVRTDGGDCVRAARELHGLDGPDAAAALRSVGFPFPGVQVRIVGADGRDVPVGDPGEIVVRSDSCFRGYWDDQAATLTTLRDGWYHTGDIGRLDDRGLLYLVDRKNDVIISGGENVYSPEVEDAISELDDVVACAVVGTPDERWGEAVCAVVVPRLGATLTLGTRVQDFVRRATGRLQDPAAPGRRRGTAGLGQRQGRQEAATRRARR